MIAGAASLGGLVSSFASPAIGWLIDRCGARVVLATSILILGLSVISLAWATVPITFYLAYGTGRVIFSSPVQIGASVVVSRWFIKLRGRANGILTVCHSAGMVVFPLIAGLIIGVWDWQRAWIVLGVIVWTVALLPVSLLISQRPEDVGLRPDGEGEQPSNTSRDSSDRVEPEWTLKQAMHTPALWILAVGTGALFLMQAGTNIHLAAYLRDQGLGQTVATLGITVNATCLGIGSIIWGWIVERVPARYVLAAVAATMATGAYLFISVDSMPEALGYSALFGLGLGGMLAVPPVAYADYFGRSSLGAIRGVTEPFASMGQAIGALVSGAIFDLTGRYYVAFIAFAILGALTAVVTLMARPPEPRRE